MHSCQLSLISKDSPEVQYNLLIEILIIGMFTLMRQYKYGMGGVSC